MRCLVEELWSLSHCRNELEEVRRRASSASFSRMVASHSVQFMSSKVPRPFDIQGVICAFHLGIAAVATIVIETAPHSTIHWTATVLNWWPTSHTTVQNTANHLSIFITLGPRKKKPWDHKTKQQDRSTTVEGKKYKHTHLCNSLQSHLLPEIPHHLFNIWVDKDGDEDTHHRERNYPESGHSMVGFNAGAGAHNNGGGKNIQGIRMVVRGPHGPEVHSLHGPTCDEILDWLQVVEVRTKYPVSNVSGRKMIVAIVSRRLEPGRTWV